MRKIFALLLTTFICVNCLNATEVNRLAENFIYRASKSFHQGERINFNYGFFTLDVDSGSLVHDLPFDVSLLSHTDLAAMPSNMQNVTGECSGFRLLPNGEHFNDPARNG